ncbi:hypothetical protein BJ684DRAFT_16723 [Piptocephalis cylindrospora]|uniref:Uncharacterized protein n=1 Tax=Piptocephalis cylindrospora TaxID=1907219 RepID=A0A4P9Y1W1_9FUNG|nr:hypothetical protein BJ684DRAFT_16723 [Piptocephalis cylindrospora]|eukprot:RKP12828.1 hypothetical protein BJ684DRAFT_16723 [Piptocephalis cylindrospora]
MLFKALLPLAITLLGIESGMGQLMSSDVFGNKYNTTGLGGVGGWMVNPCSIDNIISLPHRPGRYAGSCTGCTNVTWDPSFASTLQEYYNDDGKQQKWAVVSATKVIKGAIALKNLATGLYLGRCGSKTCEKRSAGYPNIKPVLSSLEDIDSHATWSCVNVLTNKDGKSGYKWVLSGGKGLFLGRASSPLYDTPKFQKERADYGLFQYTSTVLNKNITIPGGELVFSDISLLHDAQA